MTGQFYSGRGAARAEDAQGTTTQSHISSSILVYEEMVSDTAEPHGCIAHSQRGACRSLSSELGTYKTVRFWPWLEAHIRQSDSGLGLSHSSGESP